MTKHPPAYPVEARLACLCGVDLTSIPAVQVLTAQTIWAELGSDLSAFPTSKHFCSWLSLCPDNRTSAGKCLSTKTRASANGVAHALRMAAQSCPKARHEFGHYYRRMRAKLGAAEGLVATAPARHELALEQTRRKRVAKLHSLAHALGFELVPQSEVS